MKLLQPRRSLLYNPVKTSHFQIKPFIPRLDLNVRTVKDINIQSDSQSSTPVTEYVLMLFGKSFLNRSFTYLK